MAGRQQNIWYSLLHVLASFWLRKRPKSPLARLNFLRYGDKCTAYDSDVVVTGVVAVIRNAFLVQKNRLRFLCRYTEIVGQKGVVIKNIYCIDLTTIQYNNTLSHDQCSRYKEHLLPELHYVMFVRRLQVVPSALQV